MKKNTRASLTLLRMTRFVNQTIQLSNDFLKEYGLTTQQFDLLVQINEYEPLTQQELAKKAIVTQGSISQMIKRLETDGYVYRKQDWKLKYIYLTTKGQECLNKVFDKQLAFQTSLFEEALTKTELKELYKLTTKLQTHHHKGEK